MAISTLRRLVLLGSALLALGAPPAAALGATPQDGLWKADGQYGPWVNTISFDVEGGGREITYTNGLIGSPIDQCGWAGRWSEVQPFPIAADGTFSTEDTSLGTTPTVIRTTATFTSPTQAEVTMTTTCTRTRPGLPYPIPYPASETYTFSPQLVQPSGGGGSDPGGGDLEELPPGQPGGRERKPPNGTPYPGPPAPKAKPGCETTVAAGELEGLASCWRLRGDVYETSGRARVNGVDLTPARSGIAIRIDRRTQRISSTGPVEVRVGELRLLRAPLNWRTRTLAFSIDGRSAKEDPGPRFALNGQTFLKLPVKGSVELKFEGGQTKLKVSVAVPDNPALRFLSNFEGWSGDIVAAATNSAGLVLDGATVKFPGLQAGFVEVDNATFGISRAGDTAYHFDGGATLYPFRSSPVGFSGELGFGVGDGYFKLGAGAEQLNRSLFYGFFLQKIAFAAQVNPFGLRGSAGVTFGPQFRLGDELISTARLDGGMSYLSGSDGKPSALELTGDLEVVEAQLAGGKVKVAGGKVDASGNATLKVAKYGIEGNVAGWFDGLRAFNLEGGVKVVIPGPDQAGEAVLSSRGVGSCRTAAPRVGFGYTWGQGLGGLDVFGGSCEIGRWREVREAGSAGAAQAGGQSVRVARGQRTLVLSAAGRDAAPRVAFVGPDGSRYEPSAAEDGAVATDRALLFQDDGTRATYFAIDRPAAGRWRIEPLPGSSAVARYRTARPLPPLRIAARVAGRGDRRTLRVRLRNRAGAAVTFVEQGARSRRTIGRVIRARARLRFRPAQGPGGRRRIVALVERGGHPTGTQRSVTTFRTTRVRPAGARRVRVRRAGTRRIVTWRGPRSLRYVAVARTGDGRRLRYVVRPGGRRRVVVDHVPRGVRLRVGITGVARGGETSRTARWPGARPGLRAPKPCRGSLARNAWC